MLVGPPDSGPAERCSSEGEGLSRCRHAQVTLFFPLAITSLVTLAITFFSALAVAFEATSLSRCLRPRLAPASRSPSLAIGPAVHGGQPLDTCSTFAPDVSECAEPAGDHQPHVL